MLFTWVRTVLSEFSTGRPGAARGREGGYSSLTFDTSSSREFTPSFL